jgi:hypothetical protein
MAHITLTARYETPLGDDIDAVLAEKVFRLFNEEAAELSSHSTSEIRVRFQLHQFAGEGRFCWSVAEEFDGEVYEPWDADRLSRSIASAAERFESVAITVLRSTKLNALIQSLAKPMRESLQTDAPIQATARIPLRQDDHKAIGPDPVAFVQAAMERPFPFSVDIREQLDGMSAAIEGSHLIISGASPRTAGQAAAAFVRAPRPIVPSVGKRSYWAYGTVAIMAASFVLSWFSLCTGSVIALGTSTIAVTMLALLLGRRDGLTGHTVIGMVPVLILVAFAIVYSIAGLTGATLELQGEPLHLRDTLLLSLSLASTVGLLDLSVSGWLRSIAYLEMLLVASYLGTAALISVRSFSIRLDQTISELRLERERG